MRLTLNAAMMLSAAVAAGCQITDVEGLDILDIGSETHEISGEDGNTKTQAPYSSAAYLTIVPVDATGMELPVRYCSGVLVSPTLVLTNSDCVQVNADFDAADKISVQVGTDIGTDPSIVAKAIHVYRYVDTNPDQINNQLALVELSSPSAGLPATVNTAALDSTNFVGEEVVIAGFGESSGTSDDRKYRTLTTMVDNVQATFINADDAAPSPSEDPMTTCRSDRGAPVFSDSAVIGENLLVAITAGPTVIGGNCATQVPRIRVDRYALDFILPLIQAIDGPCPLDGTCETAGCGDLPDPDCDDCTFGNGICETGCPIRDFDCPLGSFAGNECTNPNDCENEGGCVAATDDPSYMYCTRSCDANNDENLSCPQDMDCVSGECQFTDISRGSQGYSCAANDACRSGICEGQICVFECDPASDTCPDETLCIDSKIEPGTNVCRVQDIEGGGGFCNVGTGRTPRGTLFGVLAIMLAAFVSIRRKR